MMVDKNEFFREATLRLCSSLEIEKCLLRCFNYISRFMPTLCMNFSYISPQIGGIEVLADADIEGEKKPTCSSPCLLK